MHEQDESVVSKTIKRRKPNLLNDSQDETVSQHVQLKIKDNCLQINGEKKNFKAITKENRFHFNLTLSAKSNKVAVDCSNSNDLPIQQIQRVPVNEKRVNPRLHRQTHGILDDKCVEQRVQQRAHHQRQIMRKSQTSSLKSNEATI